MNTKTRLSTETARQGLRAILATLLTIAMVLTFIPGGFIAPLTARADEHTWSGAGSSISVASGDTVILTSTSSGTLNVPNGAEIYITDGGIPIANGNPISISMTDADTVVNWDASYSKTTASYAQLVSLIPSDNSAAGTFNFNGGLIFNTGTSGLDVTPDWTSAALFAAGTTSGVDIVINGGAIEQVEGSLSTAVRGAGNITVKGGTVRGSADIFYLTGDNKTLTIEDGTIYSTASGGATIVLEKANSSLDMKNVTFPFLASQGVNTLFRIPEGDSIGERDIKITGSVTVNTDMRIADNVTITKDGTLTLSSNRTYTVNTGVTITNEGIIHQLGTSASLVNNGTILLSGGNMTTNTQYEGSYGAITNNGTILLDGGTIMDIINHHNDTSRLTNNGTIVSIQALVTAVDGLTTPDISDITDNAGTITSTEAYDTGTVDITATVSEGWTTDATATYWADAACTTTELTGEDVTEFALSVGANVAYVKVVSESGTVTNIYTMTITRPTLINITTQPAATTNVTQGAITQTLTVAASVSPSGTATYQWYINGTATNTGGTSLGSTGGANTATLTIPTTLTESGSPYYYYCVVSATGAADVTSRVATVNVTLPALGGMASITGTNAIGQTLLAVTTSITGGSGTFSYQWQAGGVNISGETSSSYAIKAADVGKTITCVITRADATGNVIATLAGGVVPYNITISNIDMGEDDEGVELSATTGRAGDIITLSYVLGETDDGGDPTTTNTLSFTGGTGLVNLTTAGTDPVHTSQTYTVNASDAVDGVITIVATFLHTDLEAQTLSFAESHVDKDLGDDNFTNALTKSQAASTGTITYSSSTPGIAAVDTAGEVTIVSAGTVTITASIAADTTYAGASASYTLTVTDPADADNAAIAAAKDLVEDETYEADQADVGSEEEAKAAVEAIIGELELDGVGFVVNPVLFTAAQAESEFEAGDGVDGSYTFTVTLSKGVGTPADTETLSLTINHTAAEEVIIPPQQPSESKPAPDIKPTPAPFTPASFSTNLYLNALGREPDEAGYDYWMTGLLDGSLSAAQVVYGFVFSAEMNEKNLNNEEFIEYLYMAFFGREPDAGGYAYWLAALNSHGDRVLIFHGFAGSLEFELFCEAHGFVVYNTAAVNF
ncbi:MAG: DUF4214 domain-containing protein [Oscillospiraceae bacterium]|nr:DUF4214 domain-containing protein [Oscillospiraceae bacterium]